MLGTTLLEMVSWLPELWKGIELPPKLAPYSQDVVDEIMTRNYNLTCAYEEPLFFQQQLHRFFRTHLIEFTRIYDTIVAEYNPLENYDRNEDTTEIRTPDLTTDSKYHDGGSYTDKGKTDSSGSSYMDSTTTGEISAMNSSSYQPDDKSVTNQDGSSTNNTNSENTRTNNLDGTGQVKETGDETTTRKSHVHGNIGVTTTQEMIEQERRIARFNMYIYISMRFEEELMIRVY